MKKHLLTLSSFIFGIGIGAVLTFLIMRSSSPHPTQVANSNLQSDLKPGGLQKYLDKTFDKDFFSGGNDPFKEMQKMRERMRDLFEEDHFDHGFDQWYGNRFGGKMGEISSHEDDQFYYYELSIKNIDQDSMKFEVQDGQLSVQGTYRSEEGGVNMSSTFMRSFPLPDYINPQAMTSSIEGDKLIIKFPKVSGQSI